MRGAGDRGKTTFFARGIDVSGGARAQASTNKPWTRRKVGQTCRREPRRSGQPAFFPARAIRS